MPSFASISDLAISQIGPISFTPASLVRLATARTIDPIVFLEITARANNVTVQTDVLSERPGVSINPISALSISSLTLPRQERESTSFLFSTRPWTGAPHDVDRPNQRAIPRIISAGRITRSAPVSTSARRRGQRTIGDVTLANPDGGLDDLLTNFTLKGGTIRAWLAQPGETSADWAAIYEATIGTVEATRKEIRIGITTIADNLERSLHTARYSGGGGITGDANVAGRLKPVCFGEAWGVDPVLISQADNIYQVHDGQIQAVGWVREGGFDYIYTQDFATFQDLQNATLSNGEYATCLAEGIFRIGTTLAGLVYPIRAGVSGDNNDPGFVSSTGDILFRLARNKAGLEASQLDVDSFNALPSGQVQYYSNGSRQRTVADVFDALLGGVSGIYGVGRDAKVTVGRLVPAANQANDFDVRGEQILDVRIEDQPIIPRVTQPYTYAPTWAPLSANEISPLADGSVAARLQVTAQSGAVTQETSQPITAVEQPTLTTYFTAEGSARLVALDALDFVQGGNVPVRVDLGRLGLLADVAGSIGITEGRFTEKFRGVISEQEDNLGAVITSRVVAIG